MLPKHQLHDNLTKSIETEIETETKTPDWIYSWLYFDLQEFELTNKLKYGLESKKHYKKSLPSKGDRVQKIRDKLTHLQTQTVSIKFPSSQIILHNYARGCSFSLLGVS